MWIEETIKFEKSRVSKGFEIITLGKTSHFAIRSSFSLNNRRARFLIFVPENHPLSLSPNHQWKKRSIRIYPLCAKASSVPFFSFESSPYRCQEDKLSRWKGCQGLVCITGKIHRNGIPSSFKAGFFLPLTISHRENVVVYERSARMREIRTSQRLSVK